VTIVQALKDNSYGVLVTWNDRRMAWSKADHEWVVWNNDTGRDYCRTKDQHTAVDFLVGKR
jgi:hypothetical protein